MEYKPPDQKEWKRLYEVSHAVKKLAPWQWMEETDVFGLKDPGTGELHLVSIMGSLGEHFATTVYVGNRGVYGFFRMQAHPGELPAETLLEIPQLHASYENRDQITKDDREVMKALGHRYRGRYAWPLFRSYRPGYVPWLIESHEARLLIHALEQVLDVAPRIRDDPDLLSSEEDEGLMVRAAKRRHGKLLWEDHRMPLPPPEFESYIGEVDHESLEELGSATRGVPVIEVDVSMLPASFGPRGTRPVIPYLLLITEPKSGIVLGSEMLQAEPTLNEMWTSVPATVVNMLADVELRPSEIHVSQPRLRDLLLPLRDLLGIDVQKKAKLPSVDAVREGLVEHLMQA